ncbi:MAG: hypothetical protein L6Q37_16335, partial [Bdellovibrionaceae bacterium]|nr:hypothetical protein [Pseudobdellovibrionaceae bacterium]
MGYHKIVFFLVILFISKLQALSISVTGATAFVQDATTTTNLTINAGLAMPDNCESTDNINTCNSCTGKTLTSGGKTFPAPCNEASIYSNLVLTISVASDKTDINGLVVSASKSATYSDTKFSTAVPDTTVNGKSYSFSASWGTLISEITSSDSGSGTFNITDCSTNCGGTRTFYFGPIKDSAYVEKIAVTINLSIINSSTSAELNSITRALTGACPLTVNGGLTTAYSSYGLCYYEIIPGDEKVYIADNIPGWGSSPKEPDTGLKLSSVVMFYAEQDEGVSALDTLKKIQNNSPKASLEITDSSTDPLGEYKISDLSNDKSYCFMSALKDITGNIQYFMDVQQINTLSPAVSDTDLESLTFSKFCAQPSEVIGVLGDKNCFIATATFGSSLHPYLNVLRKFRDTFLIQHSWGKKFIKWYYQNGPI